MARTATFWRQPNGSGTWVSEPFGRVQMGGVLVYTRWGCSAVSSPNIRLSPEHVRREVWRRVHARPVTRHGNFLVLPDPDNAWQHTEVGEDVLRHAFRDPYGAGALVLRGGRLAWVRAAAAAAIDRLLVGGGRG